MDFKYKTIAEIEAMTAEEKNQYAENKRAYEKESAKKEAEKIAKEQSDKALEQFKKDQEEVVKAAKNDITELRKLLNDAQEEIASIKESGTAAENGNEILEAIKANAELISKSIDNKGYQAEFTVKANVTRASVVNSTDALRLTDIGQLAYRRFIMRDLFPVIPVGKNTGGVVRYTDWDEATIVRAAAMVAEGGVFPESTAVWQEYTLDLKKVGDSIPVTEEMLNDQERFAGELEEFLNVNVSIVEDDQLFDGDGTGQNLNGIYTSADTFTPVASGITDASIYDLLTKVSESISAGKRSKYQPNFVLMNIIDINKMILKKDANNNYIRPPFSEGEAVKIGNLTVIESNAVTPNTLLVGDRNFAKIYEVEGYNITTGMVNDQFTRDLMTMKAKKRMNLLVREADKSGFQKVTDIAAALVTLAA